MHTISSREKTMRTEITKSSQFATRDIYLTHPELLVFNKIEWFSRIHGYAFISNDELAHKLSISVSQLKRYLFKLEQQGMIIREKRGKNRLIWTAQNFMFREKYLHSSNIDFIGKIKIQKPIFLSKNELPDEPSNELPDELPDEPHHPPCFEREKQPSNIYNTPNISKERGSIGKSLDKPARENTTSPPPLFSSKKSAASGRLLKRDFDKEVVGDEIKSKLYSIYPREFADKKIASTQKHMKDLGDQGKFELIERIGGADKCVLAFANRDWQQKVERKQEKLASLEKKPASIEEIIEARKRKALNCPELKKFAKFDEGGFSLDCRKIPSETMDKFRMTGISFANDNFDSILEEMIGTLHKLKLY